MTRSSPKDYEYLSLDCSPRNASPQPESSGTPKGNSLMAAGAEEIEQGPLWAMTISCSLELTWDSKNAESTLESRCLFLNRPHSRGISPPQDWKSLLYLSGGRAYTSGGTGGRYRLLDPHPWRF